MRPQSNLNTLVKVSVLGTLAFLIMFMEFPLVAIFPEFLKVDFSDFPALLAGFALGPVPGVIVMFFKNFLHYIFKTQTMGIGELGNFLVGAAMVYTSAHIYKRNRTFKGALKGLIVGSVAMVVMGVIANYLVLLPLYAKYLGYDTEGLIYVTRAVNAFNETNVNSLWGFIAFAIVPFNILKAILVSFVTLLLYKRVSPLINSSTNN